MTRADSKQVVRPGFAVWVTGRPASGKSTITSALVEKLRKRRVDVAVLESDVLRRVLSAHPTYQDEDRENFYRVMVWIGKLLSDHGVHVVFDATANRRRYRDAARSQITDFIEVHVDCPLEVCMERDPKGIYRRAREGDAPTVPGLGSTYEPPLNPDVMIAGDTETPDDAAKRILEKLIEKAYV
jgi:adenylylsulfate kinase